MAYTEIKQRNQMRYYYRVISIREGNKIKKKRIYLGVNLLDKDLAKKEIGADKGLRNYRASNTLNKIKGKIIKILRKHGIRKAGIFGSYARGEQRKNSDIDVIIEPQKRTGFGFVRIMYDLENELGKKVDLLTYGGINPLLKRKILEDEKRILNG
jgi:predicted nucleotidyltransferase